MIVEGTRPAKTPTGAGQFRGGCGIKKVYQFWPTATSPTRTTGTTRTPTAWTAASQAPRQEKPSSGRTAKRSTCRPSARRARLRGRPPHLRDGRRRWRRRPSGARPRSNSQGRSLEPAQAPSPPRVSTVVTWSVATAPSTRQQNRKREEIKASRSESRASTMEISALDEQRRMIAETRRKFNEWLSGELSKARGNEGNILAHIEGFGGRGGFGRRPAQMS